MARLTPQQVFDRIDWVKKNRTGHEKEWRENIKVLSAIRRASAVELSQVESDINLCHSTVRTMVPGIYFKGPDMRVAPANPQGIASAPLVRSILEHRFRMARAKRQFKRQVTDAFVATWGYVKAGYVREEITHEIDPEDPLAPVPDSQPAHPMSVSPGTGPLQMSLAVGAYSTLGRVSPFDVVFDSNAVGPNDEDLEWIAHKVLLHVDDCKGNPYIKQGRLRLIKPMVNRRPVDAPGAGDVGFFNFDIDESSFWGADLGPKRAEFGQQTTSSPDDEGKFFAWEFWNLRHQEVYLLPVEQPDFFLRDTDMEYPGHPFFGLCLTVEAPEEPYSPPLLSMIRSGQFQLNELRAHMTDHVKRAVPKYVIDTTMVDEGDQNELMQGGAAPVCRVKGDVTKAMTVVQGAALNQEVHVLESKIRSDIAETSGVADFQRGTPVGKETTATEQSILARSVSKVMEENQDRVADVIVECSRFIIKLEKMFTDKPQVVKIVGSSDVEWREWTKDDIQGEWDIEVVAGSQLITDRAIASKIALDGLNLVSPILLQGIPIPPPLYHLLYNTLETMGYRNIDLILPRDVMLKPPQDPMAENALFERGGSPEVGMNDDDDIHIQVHTQLLATPGLDPWISYRIGEHLRKHEIQKAQKIQSAMMAQQSMLLAGQPGQGAPGQPPGGGPSMPGKAPPPGGSGGAGRVNGPGAGRQAPAPGNPANPRQFSEGTGGQGLDDIMRALGRPQGVRPS